MQDRFVLKTSRRQAAPGARKTGRGNPNELIQVTIVLKAAVAIDKDGIRAEALKPMAQRSFLTGAEHAARYGASDEAIAAVKAFAAQYLSLIHISRPTRSAAGCSPPVPRPSRSFRSTTIALPRSPRSSASPAPSSRRSRRSLRTPSCLSLIHI